MVADYRADPLVHHGNPTLALSAALFTQFDVLPERARALRLPVLLQHGLLDELTDPAGSRRLAAELGRRIGPCAGTRACGTRSTTSRSAPGPLADLRDWLAAHR